MNRRRGVGVGAIKKKKDSEERYASLAEKLEATQEQHVSEFLGSFKATLEAFAAKHKKKIRSDPLFRSHFTAMCSEIGVDPLRSHKGFWSEALGVGDYYFELGVKIIEACAQTREVNGGLMTLDELAGHLGGEPSLDDLRRAIAKLAVLGDGLRLLETDSKRGLVISVPVELNTDHTLALDLARREGKVTVDDLTFQGRRDTHRATAVLTQLTKDGFAWIDEQEQAYYFPSIWLDAKTASNNDR